MKFMEFKKFMKFSWNIWNFHEIYEICIKFMKFMWYAIQICQNWNLTFLTFNCDLTVTSNDVSYVPFWCTLDKLSRYTKKNFDLFWPLISNCDLTVTLAIMRPLQVTLWASVHMIWYLTLYVSLKRFETLESATRTLERKRLIFNTEGCIDLRSPKPKTACQYVNPFLR